MVATLLPGADLTPTLGALESFRQGFATEIVLTSLKGYTNTLRWDPSDEVIVCNGVSAHKVRHNASDFRGIRG
jgi:hypothetical protein